MRFARFCIVGALGIGVQLATVAMLAHGLGSDPVLATAVGVGAALVHNFLWHVRWTWQDRVTPDTSRIAAFTRFVGANGVVSLVGSTAMMPALIGLAHLQPIPANLVTIATCGVLNFSLGGLVFDQIEKDVKEVKDVKGHSAEAPSRP